MEGSDLTQKVSKVQYYVNIMKLTNTAAGWWGIFLLAIGDEYTPPAAPSVN